MEYLIIKLKHPIVAKLITYNGFIYINQLCTFELLLVLFLVPYVVTPLLLSP